MREEEERGGDEERRGFGRISGVESADGGDEGMWGDGGPIGSSFLAPSSLCRSDINIPALCFLV